MKTIAVIPARLASTRLVRGINVLGLPAISLPCGYAKNGLPVGVQIVGRPFAEAQVLAFAQAYEQATQWHSSRPKV